ncbi:beta-ketoacyl-ACP synthase II [Priestia taiwanensis]|uniref:3-oxoacyl-[acyl-carrier-protein] synthase 2 n=1 Tax=Priestia taiwanensis TaxID=1347902 RepID=A0A917ANS4_9BACI|nr:beta-ketoacyl-ACP synthase II [Priestia taiwanensis]MBM7362240.1 3-oxoacyl-[acyl-carrier-protein] synthase II [Priestia taiwanensis]GGE60552.1 3-oxoacyl-[acyl-carrier-protein] synthase 2 [Priestia taiwanensis]
MERVVITGMGAITPLGHTVGTFWGNLVEGKSGISPIDTFDTENYKVKIAGEIKDFSASDFFEQRETLRLDRFCQFALAAADQAWTDSGLDMKLLDSDRIGVYVGSAIGGIETLLRNIKVHNRRGPRKVQASLVPMFINNMAAAQISIKWGTTGPTIAPATACAIGNTAIGEAFKLIRNGEMDVMFAGGTEASINEIGMASFGNATAVSTRNDEPTKASRPFDVDRDGFVMSEGAGILMLESLSHAKKRNAKIYAEIIGYGISSDSHHVVSPHPEGQGAYKAMTKALESANISPDKVDVINAHGTSTILGDRIETLAIKKVFGERAYTIPVTSNKSMIGHMQGASGAIEAIALVKTLQDGIIPPTINLENPDPECDLDYVPNVAREADADIGLSNSFGFGGHNAVILMKKYTN